MNKKIKFIMILLLCICSLATLYGCTQTNNASATKQTAGDVKEKDAALKKLKEESLEVVGDIIAEPAQEDIYYTNKEGVPMTEEEFRQLRYTCSMGRIDSRKTRRDLLFELCVCENFDYEADLQKETPDDIIKESGFVYCDKEQAVTPILETPHDKLKQGKLDETQTEVYSKKFAKYRKLYYGIPEYPDPESFAVDIDLTEEEQEVLGLALLADQIIAWENWTVQMDREDALKRAKEEIDTDYSLVQWAWDMEAKMHRFGFCQEEDGKNNQYVYIGFDGLTKRVVTTDRLLQEDLYE